jgi:predicted O-methyltransferase YrrM
MAHNDAMAIPGFVRRIGRALGLRRPPRYLRVPAVEFQSGLGDGGWLLHGLVRAIAPDVCVEIGSSRGLSACYIGLALKQLGRGRLYAIDPHTATAWNDAVEPETLPVMRQNLRIFGVENYVTIIRSLSHDAAAGWSRPIDVLFIDGDHSYEGVRRDWELFSPHVRRMGIVIFHDTLWELAGDSSGYRRDDMGVPRFVDELRRNGYPVVTVDGHYGISLVQPVRCGAPLVAP